MQLKVCPYIDIAKTCGTVAVSITPEIESKAFVG